MNWNMERNDLVDAAYVMPEAINEPCRVVEECAERDHVVRVPCIFKDDWYIFGVCYLIHLISRMLGVCAVGLQSKGPRLPYGTGAG